MDPRRFDELVRDFPTARRRDLLAGLAGGLIAALPLASPPSARARNKKKRKKGLQRNDFGCVDVGKACRGNDANCCSGVCDGDKPKQGKRDQSRCAAHDASTCVAGQTIDDCGGVDVPCTTSANLEGDCVTTTGKAPYCFADGDCFVCKKDADCVPFCGPQAACIPCGGECVETGNTACVGIGECIFPNGKK
jgi:hypothetical protein